MQNCGVSTSCPGTLTRRAGSTSRGSVAAVAATFGLAGLLIAQGVARMPSIRDQVGATSVQLGLALVAIGVGSVATMPFAGRFVERWGSRRVITLTVVVCALGWSGVSLARSPLALGLVMLGLGAGIGVWDVAMNVQGHHVEQLRVRSLMPRFHGAYSGGMVIGALMGAGAARLALPLHVQLPAMGALVLVAVVVSVRAFVPDDHAAVAERAAVVEPTADEVVLVPAGSPAPSGRRGITGLEVIIGLICLSTAIGEGAAGDWLAILLVDDRGALESIGALTFAAFNVTMMLGRFGGGPAIERLGRVTVLRLSGACAAVGVLLVCLVPSLYAALAGGLLWGLGLATVFPATMSAAGEVPGRGARAIGVVSTIGYGGFLLGAPSIGLLTAHIGLDRALLVIAGFALLIVALAGWAAPRGAQQSAAAVT